MIKFYLYLFLVAHTLQSFSQTTIAKQSFETTGDTWIPILFSTPPCAIADDIWNYQNILENITPSDGNQFWGIQDLNGNCGSNDFETISLPNINISQYRNVQLQFDYQAFEFDNGDMIKYEVSFDDIPQGEVILLQGNSNLSTNNWETAIMNIPNDTDNVSITISIKQNGAADYAGIDNIKLEGSIIIHCSELMISEYLEGSSSSDHRNNYIEIYNPTNQNIDLTNYSLKKYTNDNTNTTGEILFTGTLAPYNTFTIEDALENLNITSNLSSTSSVMDFNGNDKIALLKNDIIIDLIGIIGDNDDFAKDITLRRKSSIQNPNNEYNINEWDLYSLENIENINRHVSVCSGAIPEIEVSGNAIEIINGSTISNFENNTYFGSIDTSTQNTINKSFSIKNTGSGNLIVSNIDITGADTSNFSLKNNITTTISPNESALFSVEFSPSNEGIKTATINIYNNDDSENIYNFVIQGEGTGVTDSPIIITQYYEGVANNKWIEITNISKNTIPNNTYYLALYRNDDAANPIGIRPNNQKLIPEIESGQTLKFCSTLNVTFPEYAIDGNEIKSQICSFTGNDIIILSTTNDETCWANKVDIIGNSSNWGENKSLVRKYGCHKVSTTTSFNLDDWIIYDMDEINAAITGFNLRIGEHYTGSTTFENDNIWNNGTPDINRNAIINSNYNANTNGNITSCNLTINNNTTVGIQSTYSLIIQNDLTVLGTLNIYNKGSLQMINSTGLVTNTGNINIHKTTTTLKKQDYTYWSSPIKNAKIREVFAASPKNSFYQFETQNYEDLNLDSFDDDANDWITASETMQIGVGYTAMAPNTNPFINEQSIIFSGEVNNGAILSPVYLSQNDNDTNDDWNLIGNPYPSAIDAELFLDNNINKTLLNGSIYFWTHNTSPQNNLKYTSDDYAMYTLNTGGIMANSQGEIPTKYIASCQGFFIEAKQEGNIQFTNTMRVSNSNSSFFKSNTFKNEIKEDRIWLNLHNNDGAFSQILIGFLEGATSKYETNFDGLRLHGNSFLSFFSMVEQQQLAIQALPPFNGNEVIQLGFNSKIEEQTNLKISIDHIEGNLKNIDLYLTDHHLNKTHLLNKSSYTFSLDAKENSTERFSLHFKNKTLTTSKYNKVKTKLILKKENNRISIHTTKNDIIETIYIYDLLGRKLYTSNPNKAHVFIPNNKISTNKILIIHTQLENGDVSSSKFLN